MTAVVLALAIGFLFAVGTYLVLRRDVVRVVWGVAILSQAANVYLVTMSSLPGTSVPIIEGHGDGSAPATVDPLVQALVLTAIVIGFGTTAFALVLTYRTYEEHGTIDLLDLADGVDDDPTAVTDGGDETNAAPGSARDPDTEAASGEGDEAGTGTAGTDGGESA